MLPMILLPKTDTMRATITATTVALLIAGCGADPARSNPMPDVPAAAVAVDAEFELRPGGHAWVGGAALLIGFDGVADDTRCPSDVTCVWAGNARVRLHTRTRPGAAAPLELNTGVEPRAAERAGYRVELVALSPRPSSTRPVPAGDHVARLKVTRR